VIAPIAVERGTGRLLNVNGDTAAGAIAAALGGSRLVFLTDVPGVLDADGRVIARMDAAQTVALRANGVLKGGMIPKIDACLYVAREGGTPCIVDGRTAGALLAAVEPAGVGTRFAL
jgi:acetylglutamate kinase